MMLLVVVDYLILILPVCGSGCVLAPFGDGDTGPTLILELSQDSPSLAQDSTNGLIRYLDLT